MKTMSDSFTKHSTGTHTRLYAHDSNMSFLFIPIYAALYIPCFIFLEKHSYTDSAVVHMAADDRIPFCEAFIIPYLMWFLYMIGVIVASYFTDRDVYVHGFFYMASGMTIFLIVSFLFPNYHDLRPEVMPRSNVLSSMVNILQRTDTPSNLFPSLHVHNSIAAHITVMHNRVLRKKKWICNLSLVLCISIILSTLLIKQHSLFDIITAITMSAVLYPFFFDSADKTTDRLS